MFGGDRVRFDVEDDFAAFGPPARAVVALGAGRTVRELRYAVGVGYVERCGDSVRAARRRVDRATRVRACILTGDARQGETGGVSDAFVVEPPADG